MPCLPLLTFPCKGLFGTWLCGRRTLRQTRTSTALSSSFLAQPGGEINDTGGCNWEKVYGKCRKHFQKAGENRLGPRQQPWGTPFNLHHRSFLYGKNIYSSYKMSYSIKCMTVNTCAPQGCCLAFLMFTRTCF